MASWRQLYTATIIETDTDNLGVLIDDTFRAIEVRLKELQKSMDGDGERKEIFDAASALRDLKADRHVLNEDAADVGF